MTRKDVNKIGSPVFDLTGLLAADLAAGGFIQIDLDEGIYKKYVPFDFFEIYNSSAVKLELSFNDVHHFPLPPNAMITKSDLQFRRFRITNSTAGATGADTLFASVQHAPLDADKVARRGKGLLDYLPLAGLMR
jgi:hypothetical protein